MKQPISTKNPSVPTWPQHVSIAEASEMLSPGNWLGKPKQLGRFGSLRPPDIDRELVEEKFWLVQSNPCCWYVFDILFKYDICNILLYIIIHLAICIYIYHYIYMYIMILYIYTSIERELTPIPNSEYKLICYNHPGVGFVPIIIQIYYTILTLTYVNSVSHRQNQHTLSISESLTPLSWIHQHTPTYVNIC